MTITVHKPYEYPQEISVNVEGTCNHADYEVTEEEEDIVNQDGPDWSYKVYIRTCNKCGCYKVDDEDAEWQGIDTLPII